MKDISTSTHQTVHIIVIVFHVVVAFLIYRASQSDNFMGYNSGSMIRGCALLLALVALLGLIPVLKYDEVKIN